MMTSLKKMLECEVVEPLITIAIPSYNQGRFLDQALASIFEQELPVEVFVLDGGSTDNSIEVISRWQGRLRGFRSFKDSGQAAAINEGIRQGVGKYVCWLNSDDFFLPGGLLSLVFAAEANPDAPMVYGRCRNLFETTGAKKEVWVEPFSERRLLQRCIISQPATLIRRTAWERVDGVDQKLQMAMDYDLWWRLYKTVGEPLYVDRFIAINRVHKATKTNNNRKLHYQEAIDLIRRHHGRVPLKWWLAQPYAVWWRSLL